MELTKEEQDFIIRIFKNRYHKDLCIASGNAFKNGDGVNTIWIF